MIYEMYKQLGETPLDALERFRHEQEIDANTSMTFAGRLDPMAEGWMYVLSGDDVYRKEEFTALDKSYELHVLWGVETDTYDLLGIPRSVTYERPSVSDTRFRQILKQYETDFAQPYPPFSAKPVSDSAGDTKPLWKWSREGQLDEIEVPTKRVTIYEIEHRGDYTIAVSDLIETVRERCDMVRQDFRQDEIKEAWENALVGGTSDVVISKLSVSSSAGTYMRSLAHELGGRFGCGGCAFWIKRDHSGS